MTPLEQALQRLRDPDAELVSLCQSLPHQNLVARLTGTGYIPKLPKLDGERATLLARTYLQTLADVSVVLEIMDEYKSVIGKLHGALVDLSVAEASNKVTGAERHGVCHAIRAYNNLFKQDIMEGK